MSLWEHRNSRSEIRFRSTPRDNWAECVPFLGLDVFDGSAVCWHEDDDGWRSVKHSHIIGTQHAETTTTTRQYSIRVETKAKAHRRSTTRRRGKRESESGPFVYLYIHYEWTSNLRRTIAHFTIPLPTATPRSLIFVTRRRRRRRWVTMKEIHCNTCMELLYGTASPHHCNGYEDKKIEERPVQYYCYRKSWIKLCGCVGWLWKERFIQ